MHACAMNFDDPDVRAAYIAGVNAALVGIMQRLPGGTMREMEAWLALLGGWSEGPPPLAPTRWKYAN